MNPFKYLLYSSLVSVATCRPATDDPVVPGHDYFLLETGRFTVYDVEEQRYGLTTGPVRQTYQLKETVGPAYTDVTGQTAYRLIRHRRATPSRPWQPDSLWSARVTKHEAIRTENGLDFVRLVFPVSDQLRWNGNRYNTLGKDDYELRNNSPSQRVLDKQFDKTVTVVEQDDSTLLSQDKRVAVYARQVGLIYRERTQLQYCSSSPSCVGKYQIDYGIRQVYRIQTYGRE